MQLTITLPIENTMSFILDKTLDSVWAGIVERQYIGAAAHVAFNLAFVTVLSSDDQATVANGSRRQRR